MNQTVENLYAGFWIRFLAMVIDCFIWICLVWVLSRFFPSLGTANFTAHHAEVSFHTSGLPLLFGIAWTLLFWNMYGGTPGKIVLGLKIVNGTSLDKMSIGQSIGRYFAYFVSGITFGLGYIWVGFDKRKQGFHDKIANTVVIYKRNAVSVNENKISI